MLSHQQILNDVRVGDETNNTRYQYGTSNMSIASIHNSKINI